MLTLRQGDTRLGRWLRGLLGGRMPTRRWSWQPRWCASSGRCCATGASTGRRPQPPDPSSAGADAPAVRCLRAVRGRWPDSKPVFWKPPGKNGDRRRPFYEAQDARISILANGSPEGRIRLCRLHRPADPEPLADGAGRTFGRDRCAVQGRPAPVDLTRRVQALQQDLMQARPDARLLPVAQAPPATHPAAAAHFGWQHLPGQT